MSDNLPPIGYSLNSALPCQTAMPPKTPFTALAHLDATQVNELIGRYYAGEPVADLIAAYRIGCRIHEIHSLFPPQILENDRCALCGGVLLEQLKSRSASSSEKRKVNCALCGHQPLNDERCNCETCSLVRARAQVVHHTAVQDAISRYTESPFSDGPPARTPRNLTLWQAVSLLCLVRSGSWYSETVVGPMGRTVIPLTPEDGLTEELWRVLREARLAYPDPSSPPDAFHVHDYQVVRCDCQKVHWRIGAADPLRLVREIESIAQTEQWPPNWSEEDALSIYRQLAVAECWQFARLSLRHRGMGVPGETALRSLIDNLLQDFSVAQIYHIIWAGARNAADFLVRKEVQRSHASNFFVGSCQRWADRARADGWEVRPFSRNFDLPRTQLSYVLHDVFLKIGSRGFSEPIFARLSTPSSPSE